MNLIRRSIVSISWNAAANLVVLGILFARSVLLARWLPVETFGIYAGSKALVQLAMVFASFGMAGAFLHRAPESENEDRAAAVHFTLKLIFTLLVVTILCAWALLFLPPGGTQTTVLVLALAVGIFQLTQTPQLILIRRVDHRRLALLQALEAVFSSAISLYVAWNGGDLWALLITDVVIAVVWIVGLFVWRPVWKIHLAWRPVSMRYFLHFGSQNFLAVLLNQALDKVDDLWVRINLGALPMGYYSRAYAFAIYPRKLLAVPVSDVAGGAFAEAHADRLQLSQAFFRIMALLIRGGFFLGGLMVLIAPEFIRLFLGEKWLPMLLTFRLMLFFTLFDPLKLTLANLFIAKGHPAYVARVRLVQLLLLLAGLIILGNLWGIEGVALAVDLMLLAGIFLFLWRAREHVDYSLSSLFLRPAFSLAAALGCAGLYLWFFGEEVAGISDWFSLVSKSLLFTAVYAIMLYWLEGQTIRQMLQRLRRDARSNGSA